MAKHSKTINKKKMILNILVGIFVLLFILSVIYVLRWKIDIERNKDIANKVSQALIENNQDENQNEIVNEQQDENQNEEIHEEIIQTKIDFEMLKEINSDIIGYLQVNGTDVEYAVVQAKNNSYYLKKDLNKKYNVGGSIFADYKNKFDGTDKNIVIYGHNVRDGSMFGSLKNILEEEWYNNEENYLINFITENEENKYQVFSVYKIENEDYYIDTEFKEGEFLEFVNTLKDRSIKDFGIEVTEEDSLLTLSTCANNNKYRVVLHAKLI